jgi:hypothetical protein
MNGDYSQETGRIGVLALAEEQRSLRRKAIEDGGIQTLRIVL